MPDKSFADALNEQIANEFAASQQYVGAAVYYDAETLPRLAAFFYRQAVEERNHAMMLVQYLLDRGLPVEVPGVDPVRNTFDSARDALAMALDMERTVTEQVTRLAGAARDEGDYLGEQFMQWFLKEQIEEVDLFSSLLDVAERCRERPMEIEEYIAREGVGGAGDDPNAPPVAGSST